LENQKGFHMSQYTVYFQHAGVPREDLEPEFESLKVASTGLDVTLPTIEEVGGGHYRFDLVVSEPIVGVIDGGEVLDNRDRYIPIHLHPYDFYLDLPLSSLGITAEEIADAVLQEDVGDHHNVANSLAQFLAVMMTANWEKDGSTLRFFKPDGTVFKEFTISSTERTGI